jgi:hypothetical protein
VPGVFIRPSGAGLLTRLNPPAGTAKARSRATAAWPRRSAAVSNVTRPLRAGDAPPLEWTRARADRPVRSSRHCPVMADLRSQNGDPALAPQNSSRAYQANDAVRKSHEERATLPADEPIMGSHHLCAPADEQIGSTARAMSPSSLNAFAVQCLVTNLGRPRRQWTGGRSEQLQKGRTRTSGRSSYLNLSPPRFVPGVSDAVVCRVRNG